MPDHTLVNLLAVEDMGPRFEMPPGLESRFARGALGLQRSGLTHFRMAPGFRMPFGHRPDQEEVYVVLTGGVRARLGDEEPIEMGPMDALCVPPQVVRCLEAGRDGAEVLAFGAPSTGENDAEVLPGWWGG